MAVPGSVVGVGKLITPGGQQGVKGDPGALSNFVSQRVIFDDFLGYGSGPTLATNTFFGQLPWVTSFSGTGASIAFSDTGATSALKALGCLAINTGTTATGNGQITAAQLYPALGALELDGRILATVAPTATQNFVLQFGFSDPGGTHYIFCNATYSGGAIVNGQAANGGTASNTGNVTFTGGVFNRFQILVNAAWTSVSFYLNGTLIGSALSTNIPTATAMFPFFYLGKTVGTTGVAAMIDQFYLSYTYTS